MKKLIWIWPILVAVLLIGCSVEEFPEDQIVRQEFIVTGEFDGEPFDFSPGTNGLFMDTQVEEWGEGNYSFTAHIASEDGQGTQGELIFELVSLDNTFQSSTEALLGIETGPVQLNWNDLSFDNNWSYAT
ncbi:MAG: hypothetical protein AAF193_05925, partial [Bacteroidota bacterium]